METSLYATEHDDGTITGVGVYPRRGAFRLTRAESDVYVRGGAKTLAAYRKARRENETEVN
jgi:hypothetical protein